MPSEGFLRCQPPLIAMVQPADLWNGANLPSMGRLNSPLASSIAPMKFIIGPLSSSRRDSPWAALDAKVLNKVYRANSRFEAVHYGNVPVNGTDPSTYAVSRKRDVRLQSAVFAVASRPRSTFKGYGRQQRIGTGPPSHAFRLPRVHLLQPRCR